MKIRKLLISTLTALSLLPAFAFADQPEKCPSPAAVMAAGYQKVTRHSESVPAYEIYNYENDYGTTNKWTLYAVEMSDTAENAVLKLNNRLTSLSALEGPGRQHGEDVWVCGYANERGNPDEFEVIYTITPPQAMLNAARFK